MMTLQPVIHDADTAFRLAWNARYGTQHTPNAFEDQPPTSEYAPWEVPCGWVFFIPESILVNRWTGQATSFHEMGFATLQASIRYHIQSLPEDQQQACQSPPWSAVWALDPIRFYPPRLRVHTDFASLSDIRFTLECDNEYIRLFSDGEPHLIGAKRILHDDPQPYTSGIRVISVEAGESFTRFHIQPLFSLEKVLWYYSRYSKVEFSDPLCFISEERWSETDKKFMTGFWLAIDIEVDMP